MLPFGISTHLFHDDRLTRDHLVHIAAHGFETIELFATRSHFDYRSRAAIDELAEWLSDTRLRVHSVHAPIVERMERGRWVGPFSNASTDDARRRAAVEETAAALAVASVVPFRYLVVHLGIPDGERGRPGDNQPDAARHSLEEIAEAAAAVNVGVAIEVIPNALSDAATLAAALDEGLDGADAGVCLDYGHANLMGDLNDAIEALSGHLWTTHVHDNHGKADEHLVPFAGTIDWDAAMMGTQKIGYDGPLMFEVSGAGDPLAVLQRAARVRERLEQCFVTF